jgi:glutaredoxin 3
VRAIVYTWSSCSFCARAKELLERHGIDYREVVLDGKKDELRRLHELFGARTMPLVLLDGERVAGLEALERAVLGHGEP